MPRTSVLLALLALAACGREGAGTAAGPPPAPAAQLDAKAAPQTAAQPASYVGRWAARPELCADGAWVFEADKVTTAGEVSCQFNALTRTDSGYEVSATCFAQAPPEAETFTLSLTDPAQPQAMTVTGGPWDAAITLVRCEG